MVIVDTTWELHNKQLLSNNLPGIEIQLKKVAFPTTWELHVGNY